VINKTPDFDLRAIATTLNAAWLSRLPNELEIYRRWIPIMAKNITDGKLINRCNCKKPKRITFSGGSYCEKCMVRIK